MLQPQPFSNLYLIWRIFIIIYKKVKHFSFSVHWIFGLDSWHTTQVNANPSAPDMLLRIVESTGLDRLRVELLLQEIKWVVGKWFTARQTGCMSQLVPWCRHGQLLMALLSWITTIELLPTWLKYNVLIITGRIYSPFLWINSKKQETNLSDWIP